MARGERILTTPAGPLWMAAEPRGLLRLEWLADPVTDPGEAGPSALLDRCQAAVERYFADPAATPPCLPLAPVPATAFQRRVWRAMSAIPPGQVRTYGEVARWLGSSPRAVGRAAGANPWPLLVACHRIVASNGLGGYLGQAHGMGPAIKRRLLAHEGHPETLRDHPRHG
ncbi:methylated-DNA--[protein]-cysteine S-methyltransferase [Thiohalorhabdus sp.]|uniref:methylated-DNA--[protein]-cysteine S-methyltransferase n=1 Tax=Thiohalorhabdus sp. TaxID=3094134 RepID=UPI002FC3CF15